jgi:tetratricopeptide (TPR) repeat protein
MQCRIPSFLVLAFAAGSAFAFDECGDLANAYGPFDYRTSKDRLVIVEGAHFTADVESLRRGTTGSLGADIDYTLRASPNHHRALIAMMTLGRKLNTDQPQGAHYTITCYFDRGTRFAPDDAVVRLIYGTYLSRLNKRSEAMEQLSLALKLDPDNANIHYNLGLIYLDVKDYPNARLHAQRAYELGFALPGLKKRLEEAGQWSGSTPVPAPARATRALKAEGTTSPK